MIEVVRLCRAEFQKLRHTLIPVLHIFLPLLGIVTFLGYYSYTAGEDARRIAGYIQILTIALPLIISAVCALNIEQEEKGHFQTLLGAATCRPYPLLAKWLVLSGIGLGAIGLAVSGFALGYRMIEKTMVFSWKGYLGILLILWICSWNLYLLHLFCNMAFSKSISVCVGTAETLVAALFLTGLGEGIWRYFPCSWGGRWSGYLLLYLSGDLSDTALASMPVDAGICAGVTAAVWGLIFLWFYSYEGRQCND